MSGEGFFAYQESTVAHGEEGFNKVVLRTKALLPSCTWYISPLVLSVPVANSSSRSSLLHLARKKEFPSSSSSSSSRRLLQRSPLCVFIGRRGGERRNTNKKAKKEHTGKGERGEGLKAGRILFFKRTAIISPIFPSPSGFDLSSLRRVGAREESDFYHSPQISSSRFSLLCGYFCYLLRTLRDPHPSVCGHSKQPPLSPFSHRGRHPAWPLQ